MNLVTMLVVLPVVGAIIGYTTKSIAVQMVFRPSRFVGIGPIGWQGVVQRRAPKFAAGIADTITGSAVDINELFERVDSEEIAALLAPVLDEVAPDLARDIVEALRPGTYDTLDRQARTDVTAALLRSLPETMVHAIDEIRPHLPDLLDVRGLVVDLLSGDNADRLARLCRKLGQRELRFLIWYGAALGFLIGLVEVAFYATIERWWLLPLIGAVDGLVNNWLAIQMIFRPLERTVYLGIFPYQGLFAARQAEIAHDYAVMMATEVLTLDNLAARLTQGDVPARLLQLVGPGIDEHLADQVRRIARDIGAPPPDRGSLLPVLAQRVMPALAPAMPAVGGYIEKRLDLATTLEERLAAMPKVEFERVLRGIFEEDEATLIILGGVIGGAIGLLQAAIVVGLGAA